MGRGRNTLWIDPVSHSSNFNFFGVQELSLPHDTVQVMAFLLITFQQAIFRAPVFS